MPKSVAAQIVCRLKDAGYEAFFVGGCVRDLLLGAEPEDYDIVTSARPEEVRTLFARTIPVGEKFGVCLVVEEGRPYEVATFRTEEGYRDGRRPDRVAFATAREDVRRRDFTINGLLMESAGEIVDFVEGRRDLDAGLIRAIGDPRERFAEDHLRMLRAVRFAAALGFQIEPSTFAAIRANAASIVRISAERIREELSRILTGQGARCGMELLAESGLLERLLPEVAAMQGVGQPPRFHPEGDVWEHTLRMLALLPRKNGKADLRLAWAVLLHDAGKAVTRSEDETGVHFYGHDQKSGQIAEEILRRLRFSNEETETILALVRDHMVFMNARQMRPNRLKRLLRTPHFDLHLELHRLDCLGSHGLLDLYDFVVQKQAEYPEEALRPPRLLTGGDLIAMGFSPGPLFAEILSALEDGQLAGEIADGAAARAFVLSRWTPPAVRQAEG